MLVADLLQPLALLCAEAALTPPLGAHIARVMSGRRTFLEPALGPVERLVHRSLRLRPDREQTWQGYARSLLAFSVASVVGLLALQWAQGRCRSTPTGSGPSPPTWP
jgi:K+-transporting ATPase ATPase A chain